MWTAMSASRTCRAGASGAEDTATERMPILRSVPITRTAISPRLAIRTVSNMRALTFVTSSHPEDAVADVLERGIGRGREGQAEHGPGVARVDHAVVPQPRGRV